MSRWFFPNPATQPRGARFVNWALLFLGLYILVIFLNGFYLIRLVKREQEKLLPEYLSLTARSIALGRDYFSFLEFLQKSNTGEIDESNLFYDQGTVDWDRVVTDLKSLESEEFVKSAEVLTLSGHVVITSEGGAVPLEHRNAYLEVDRSAIQEAAKGAESSIQENTRTEMNQRRYIPLRNASNKIVGVLRLEADASKFEGLSILRKRLFSSLLVSSIFYIALYLIALRFARRSLQVERAIGQADRLRALGSMTAGISHEIRNPLGIIMLQIEELEVIIRENKDRKSSESLGEVARDLRAETQRLRNLTEDFLHFAGASAGENFEPVPTDTVKVIESLVRVWEKELDTQERTVSVKIEGQTTAMFSEDRLRQIILNLLRNADEAIGKKKGEIKIHILQRDPWVEINVIDNGPGIDGSTMRRIFDPFFTTRAEGTGLGLSMSRALAEVAGGSLNVESTPGNGAKFILLLRRAP